MVDSAIAIYYTTKHSWRGKYKRLFAITPDGVATFNPQNPTDITNKWPWNELNGLSLDSKTRSNTEYLLHIRKKGKVETMKFSTEHRDELLTEAMQFFKITGSPIQSQRFQSVKHKWNETTSHVTLEIGPASLYIIEKSGQIKKRFDYRLIQGFIEITDINGGFAISYYNYSRLYLFASNSRNEIIQACQEAAAANLCIGLKRIKPGIKSFDFWSKRMGDYSTDESLTSYVEFSVTKQRKEGSVRRNLCLTENCLLERDPATYQPVSIRPLNIITSLVRSKTNPQEFSVEFNDRTSFKYHSAERDALLATVLDSVRGAGNRDVSVLSISFDPSKRWAPLYSPPDEEIETLLLKGIGGGGGEQMYDSISRFNANVSATGLAFAVTQERIFADNKEKMISQAIQSLLSFGGEKNMESQFLCLRRLVSSKAGFTAFTTLPGFREKFGGAVVKVLKVEDQASLCSAIDCLAALMCPMHDNSDLKQEQLNKTSLLSSVKFLEALLAKLQHHCQRNSGALVISALLDFLTFAMCSPFSETTSGENFDWLLTHVAALGRSFFKLFQHPSLAIQKSAGLLMQAMIEEGNPETIKSLRTLALDEGAFLIHIHSALFSTGTRAAANRGLSRRLISLWASEFEPAQRLLKQIIPAGLLRVLKSTEKAKLSDETDDMNRDNLAKANQHSSDQSKIVAQVEKQILEVEKKVMQQAKTLMLHWRGMEARQKAAEAQQRAAQPVVLRRRRENTKITENWELLFFKCYHDHALPDLIWNYKTREELRTTLENEMRGYTEALAVIGDEQAAWNHAEFEVTFPSLADEVKVGDYFLRLLLDMDGKDDGLQIHQSASFFSQLYHRFLLTTETEMKVQCLQAMAIVYERCFEEIGMFEDTSYIIQLLRKTCNRRERDRLVIFISKLMLHKDNVKLVIDANGIKLLIDLITLAHLQKNRPKTTVLQRNAIIAGEDLESEMEEKEWFYQLKGSDREGPVSLGELKRLFGDEIIREKTKVWAQGMEGWRQLCDVPQLKWALMGVGDSLLTESELSTVILDIFIQMVKKYPGRGAQGQLIRPEPKIKRILCQPDSLPHIVQLLLTFDVKLVESVSRLLPLILIDSPLLSRLYLTGAFFFILMYTGNNVLPIASFLKMTHLQQSFRSEDATTALCARSILGPLLPEAMVHYLENYPSEKFSQIFLGEFDTPEAIWNSEMRRLMIEKIALHVADFSPRLRANTRAIYQYIPLPTIQYPNLTKELFCGLYYLRHLTNSIKFPKWPIRDPVRLLKDTLEQWRSELNKEPAGFTSGEALETLGLDPTSGPFEESKIRKAYFKMAQKYHPDKNPEGKEMFQKINKAYEHLASNKDEVCGPDPVNIRLVIKTQAILFENYKVELEPYKYAGYPMLVTTMKQEIENENLYADLENELLSPSVELAYHTVCCSSLNAEELNREDGIKTLREALKRCSNNITKGTKEDDLDAKIALFAIRCLTVSAQFPSCLPSLLIEPLVLFEDLLRLLCSELPSLQMAAVDAVAALASNNELSELLYHRGVLPILIEFLFSYDYTLEEGGIERDAESNKQEQQNRLAKAALHAISIMSGLLEHFEPKPEVVRSLESLITPYLTQLLDLGQYPELLKLFTINSETPLLIWEQLHRQELSDFLDRQKQIALKSPDEVDVRQLSEFQFSALEKELIIGPVFVRVFNEQPQFILPDAPGFLKSLLDYLGNQAQYFSSIPANPESDIDQKSIENKLSKTCMALESVKHVLTSKPELCTKCLNSLRLLASFFINKYSSPSVLIATLFIFGVVAAVKEVVIAVAEQRILSSILLLEQVIDVKYQATLLQVINALISHPEIVKQFIPMGGVLYVSDLFCNSSDPSVRKESAALLAKAISDRLSGPRVKITMAKLLPPAFADLMAENPEQAVTLFEGEHKTPDLIWSEDSRSTAQRFIQRTARDLANQQRLNAEVSWQAPAEPITNSDELQIAGIYIRLLNQNPTWTLRRPREFITCLFDRIIDLVSDESTNQDELTVLAETGCNLLTAQTALTKMIPGMGIMPTLVGKLSETKILRPILLILHALCQEALCISALAQIPTSIIALKRCLNDDAICGIAVEALYRAFNHDCSELTALAIQGEDNLVSSLIKALTNSVFDTSIKAQIVKILKNLANDLQYGAQVQEMLDESPIWKQYKDQKMDLFLADKPRFAIEASPGQTNLYLTQGSSVPDAPPPVS